MGENKEKGRVQEGRIVLVKLQLIPEIIPRIIVGMDFIHPEGFFIKVIESKCKTYEQTKKENNNILASHDEMLPKFR